MSEKKLKRTDRERLNWMIENAAQITFSSDGEILSIEWRTDEISWQLRSSGSAREAIDAAMR